MIPFPTHRENKSVIDGGTRNSWNPRLSFAFGAFDYRGGSHHRRIRGLSSWARLNDGFPNIPYRGILNIET